MSSNLNVCHFWLLSLLIILTNTTNTECPRHRKPWHLLSDTDRMQFVTGFQQLRNNGILSSFCSTHHLEGVAFEDIHKTSEFFFWHSYFVTEVESQFRLLGDDYACFSMPYWDITYDAQLLDQNPSTPTSELPIFNSMVGSDGNPENNNCVESDLWNINQYTTEFLCAPSEQSPNCCLKRQRNMNGAKGVVGFANMTEITDSFRLHRFREFQDTISIYHGKVHKFFAYTNESHMWANNAAEDPLFVLLHSFIDYIRAMRQDCWDYDKININDLDEYIPFAFDGYDVDMTSEDFQFKPTLDTKMGFAYICDIDDAYCNDNDVTLRDMFDISQWGISYELGSFWSDNEDLQEMCGGNINDTWFYEEGAVRKKEVVRSKLKVFDEDKIAYSMLLATMYVVIGLVITVCFAYIVIRQYAVYLKERRDNEDVMSKLIDDENNLHLLHAYGSV